MKESVAQWLDKAGHALTAARRDNDAGDAGFAADRAYYAMLYTAEALLEERGLTFSSHGAVHGAFGKEFAKPKVLDPKFHRWLLDAFRARQKSMYDVDPGVAEEAADRLIDQAEMFLDAARAHLAAPP